MNKANFMRAQKGTYESRRKDWAIQSDDDREVLHEYAGKSSDSRTLVKKRQPCDQKPRREKNVSENQNQALFAFF